MSSHHHELPPVPPPLTANVGRALTRFAVKTFFRGEHVDKHHIPERGGAILISNHPSYFDPWVVAYGTPRWVTWLAWEEAFDWPLAGKLIKVMGAVPLNTDRPTPSTFKTALRVLQAGRLLGVFFEGGRTSEGNFQIDPPMPGAARLAIKANVPVVPVSLIGMRRLWPRSGVPRPGRIKIRYHAPLHPAEVTEPGAPMKLRAEQLTDLVSERIRSELPECGSWRHH